MKLVFFPSQNEAEAAAGLDSRRHGSSLFSPSQSSVAVAAACLTQSNQHHFLPCRANFFSLPETTFLTCQTAANSLLEVIPRKWNQLSFVCLLFSRESSPNNVTFKIFRFQALWEKITVPGSLQAMKKTHCINPVYVYRGLTSSTETTCKKLCVFQKRPPTMKASKDHPHLSLFFIISLLFCGIFSHHFTLTATWWTSIKQAQNSYSSLRRPLSSFYYPSALNLSIHHHSFFIASLP